MYSRLPLLSLTGAGLVHCAQALSLPFAASSKDQVSDNTFSFQNVNNVSVGASIYTTELTINGQTFLVQLDTGSSDLWLDTTGVDVSQFEATGVNTSITYGDGTEALGPILIGNVTMGTFSANQAFISAPGTNATTYNDKGLLGVGPPSLSQIATTLSSTTFDGDFFLQNVFDADPSLKELISFQLSRSVSTGASEGGIFTVGEIASNLTAVSSSAQLEVVAKDRWTVLMDGIVVNGKNVTGHSAFLNANVPGQNTQQTLATLDTGTGLATIPKKYADAIYGSIPGASFSKSNGVYFVPCDAVVNVSFVFGGVEYPIHPIDTVQAFQATDGSIECISGFQPVDVDPSESTEDFLLGDSFLRNVYAVFNYGSFISGNESPSIQLLSTTNSATASSDFASLSAQRNQSLTEKATSSSNSPSSSGSSGSSGSSSSSNPASSSPSTSKKNAAVSSKTRMVADWNGLLALVLLSGMLVL